MRVLVAGSKGFCGRSLVGCLRNRGFEVVGLDISNEGLSLDITDFDALFKSLSNLDSHQLIKS